jgi:CheY-like chemotaxis protein
MSTPIPAIVVVEDEPDILVILRRVLRDLETDYDIVAVSSAEAALAYALKNPCRLLITDYQLGGMDGLQLAKTFKRDFGCRVIMISAYFTPALRNIAYVEGVDFLFAKPFQVDALEEAIRIALSRPAGM